MQIAQNLIQQTSNLLLWVKYNETNIYWVVWFEEIIVQMEGAQ